MKIIDKRYSNKNMSKEATITDHQKTTVATIGTHIKTTE